MKPAHYTHEEWELGSWINNVLSDDDKSCLEFKEAVRAWFDMIEDRRSVTDFMAGTHVIYIGGPITGHADLNKPAFDAAERQLQKEGYITFNPHTIAAPTAPNDLSPKGIWRYYMRLCVQRLAQCDELYLLAGWQNSDGAVWEYRIAQMLGMPIKYQEVT